MGCGSSSSIGLQSQAKVITESGKIFRIAIERSLQVEAVKAKMEMLIGVKANNLRLCIHQEDGTEMELSDVDFLNAIWKQINKEPVFYLFQKNQSIMQTDFFKNTASTYKGFYYKGLFNDSQLHNKHKRKNEDIEEELEDKPTTVMHKNESICLGSYQSEGDLQRQESILAAIQQIDQAQQGLCA